MKKTTALQALLASLFCLCALAFSSCSGDDDDNPASGGHKDPALVGTWMTSDGSWGYTFRADGSSVNYEGAEVYPGTWNTRDGMLLVYWDEPEPEVYTSYSIRGNALYLTDEYGDSYILYKEQSGTPGSGGEDTPGTAEDIDPDLVGTWRVLDFDAALTFRADGTCRSRDRCPRSNRSRRGIHCSEQFLHLVAQCGELPCGIGEGVNAKVLHVPSLWGREVFVGDAENENGFPVFGSEFHLDAGLFGSVEVRGVDDHHHAAHAHGVDNGSGAAFAGRYVPACHEAAYAAFLQICTNIFRHLAVMAGTRYENIVFHRLQYQKSFQS